jgi:signal peptidase I
MSSQSFRLYKPKNPWAHGLKTIGLTLALGFGVRIAAAQCYLIPSGSMKPTLEVSDRLFVDTISYHLINPHRGDIVVFTPPEAVVKQENSRDPYVKRVIGLPGEKVEIKNGQVYINDWSLSENYIANKPDYTWGPKIVPLNSYLVLGDNRNYSYDSHLWGFVERDRIIGRAVVRFWPLNRISGLSEAQS